MDPRETSETAVAPGSSRSSVPGNDQDVPLLGAVLAAQQILVLRRVASGVLTIVPPAPTWLTRFAAIPDGVERPFPATECFPYLEACLPDAEAFWAGSTTSSLTFDLWTEPAAGGEDFHLQAMALRLEAGSFLLVRRADVEHAARQQVLQLARERMLDHERLLEEISSKEVLLHCIVHDLAGPLAGIQGCLEMLAGSPLEPSDLELVQMARLQTGRQHRLIRNILDVFAHPLASPQSPTLETSLSHDLFACVDEVMEGLNPAFLSKQVRLKASPRGDLPPTGWVVAEGSRLERVLHNLLENALRFAPVHSSVVVQVQDDGDGFAVTVADEGPGVAPEVLPHLFQRFVSGGRSPGKSGLGLFFCRITLERWGGTIAYAKGIGAGARFRIRLRKATPFPPRSGTARVPDRGVESASTPGRGSEDS